MSDHNDDENVAYLAADDVKMRRFQKAEEKHLIKENQRLDLQLMENTAKNKKVKKEKEDIGVLLYGVQQQLAENQMTFERAHENFNQVQKARIDAQQKLKQVNEHYEAKRKQTEELKKKYYKAQRDLQELMRELHNVQRQNQNIKNKILQTKTVTYTAQENVVQLQKQKKRQDELIDSMMAEVKRLTQQFNITSAQLVSQQGQTKQAKKILHDALQQRQKIITNKRQLLQRWKRSLVTMSVMDKTLQMIKQSHKDYKQKKYQLIAEMSGIRASIRKTEADSQNLSTQFNKLTYQRNFLKNKGRQINQLKQKILKQHGILQSSLKNTEQQIGRAQKQQKQVVDNMNQIQSNIMRLHTQIKGILQNLVHKKSEHTTIQKTAFNLLKQAQKLAVQIQQCQIQHSNLKNQIARVNIDQLNTKSQIDLLKQRNQQVIQQRKDRQINVATYQINIRQGLELNDKRQHQVGQLNKQHDKLTSSQTDQNKGPPQNKLTQIIQDTKQFDENCAQLQRDWIKKQTSLVQKSNQLDKLGQSVRELQTKKTVLQQKKARLNENYKVYQKQIASIQISLKNLQKDMNKLNDGLAQNYDKKRLLQNQNFSIQSQFVQKLKELQKDSIKLQVDIDKLREKKANLLVQIVQAERQILLWERKIQLENQMKNQLDPNVGQADIAHLKKQIHRMELKLQALRKQHDDVIAKTEQQVYKRDAIQLKHMKKDTRKRPKDAPPQTSAQMQSQLRKLKIDFKKTTDAMKQVNFYNQVQKQLKGKQGDSSSLGAMFEQAAQRYNMIEKDVHEQGINLSLAKIHKLVNLCQISGVQGRYRKIQQINNKVSKLMFSQNVLRNKLVQSKNKNQSLKGLVQKMIEQYPQYHSVVQPLTQIQ